MSKSRLISTQEAGRMRWAGKTAAEKRAHAEMMNRAAQKARQAKRLEKAGKA